MAPEAADRIPHGFQYRPETPHEKRIEKEVRHHRVDGRLKWVEPIDGHRGRRVVTIENSQPSAAAQDSTSLPECCFRLWNVTQRRMEYGEVERLISKRQGSTISDLEGQLRQALAEDSRPVDEYRRWIKANRCLDPGKPRQSPRHRAGAAPDFEGKPPVGTLYLGQISR